MGYEYDVLPAPRRKADQHQDTVRGDLIPGMGDGKDTPETDGPHHLNKASGTDVSCQVTWRSENDSGQLQGQVHRQDSCLTDSLGQGGRQLVEKPFHHRMQLVPKEHSGLAIPEIGNGRHGHCHRLCVSRRGNVRGSRQQSSETNHRTQRMDCILKNRLTKSRSLEECRGVLARGQHER